MSRIRVNGARCYVEEHGTGDPIVFLHGLGVGSRYFEPQLESLASEYRTIAVDFRGHGRSETTEIGYTLRQFAADVEAVLDALDCEDAVLVGWSLGALVTWEYLDRYGAERVRAIVDVDMEACPYQREDYPYGTYTLESVSQSVSAMQIDRFAAIEDAIDRLCKRPPTGRLRRMMVDEMSRCSPTVVATLLFSITRDYRDVLRAIDVPMLICVGEDGKWRSAASVEHTAEFVADAQIERFPESGHCLTVEEPKRFNRVVEGFDDAL